MFSPLFEKLTNHLCCLPGIGPKSAQRMGLYILQRARDDGLKLADTLKNAIERIRHCERCRILSETILCKICANTERETDLLCIVETPADVIAIEQTHVYKGYYFVLMGHLSPLEGIGPAELGIDQLIEHVKKYQPTEIILATSSTVEGETTAHYLSELLQSPERKISRIAHGIPMGNELEFIDSNTLMRALAARKRLVND